MATVCSRDFAQASAWVNDWTPTILFWNYWIFSFFAYVAMPSVVNGVLWYTLAFTQTLVTLMVMVEAFKSIKPAVIARRSIRKSVRDPSYPPVDPKDCPHFDIVIVAYLPNEKDIIVDQARYAARELNYPKENYTVNVVYNTPEPIEGVEAQLAALPAHFDNIRIVKVPKSSSKAENVNHFVSLPSKGDIITVLDADHFLEPNALRWVAQRFIHDDVDIVQGRCCIYNVQETWVTGILGAEFDNIYGMFHAGRASLQGYGVFGGSNGHWSASLLRSLRFDHTMLTEDIDSSIRAIVSRALIVYDLRVISYEQAPTTVRAFWKQRMRWAQGWFQVALKHSPRALRTGAVGQVWRSRFGLFFLLVFREVYFHLVLQLSSLLFSAFITTPPTSWSALYKEVIGFKLSIWMLAFNLFCIVICTLVSMRNRSAFVTRRHALLFGLFSPFYFTGISLMAVFGHFREFSGYSQWNVTARKQKK